MPEDVSISNATIAKAMALHRGATLLVAGVMGVVLAGTVALWAHYGTAVFFETIRVGLVACFG